MNERGAGLPRKPPAASLLRRFALWLLAAAALSGVAEARLEWRDPGPPARAFSQACEDGSAGTELVIQHQRHVQERRVRSHYRVEGTMQAYGDVVQWYWNLIQPDHPPIVGYNLKVAAPGPHGAAVQRLRAHLRQPAGAVGDTR